MAMLMTLLCHSRQAKIPEIDLKLENENQIMWEIMKEKLAEVGGAENDDQHLGRSAGGGGNF